MDLVGRQVSLFMACFILGLILSVQFRTAQKLPSSPDIQRVYNLSQEIRRVSLERDRLREQAEKLRGVLAENKARQEQELFQARLAAGYVPVKGPGIQVTLNDSPKALEPGEDPNLYLVHDEDLLKVLNAIKGAGAEAISVNGQRILATTEVACAGTTILTGAHKLAPPFIIQAIGDPGKMEKNLLAKGGILENLRLWDLQVAVQKKPELIIPGYSGGVQFDYAKPLKEGD